MLGGINRAGREDDGGTHFLLLIEFLPFVFLELCILLEAMDMKSNALNVYWCLMGK